MRASALEYRLRYLLHALVIGLALWSPWDYLDRTRTPGANAHVWGVLAALLAQAGVGGMVTAFNIVLLAAIACGLIAACLRTWGGAYLGAGVVQAGSMHTGAAQVVPGVVEDGPFRHLRNPLYVGTVFHVLALCLLMSRAGAIFCLLVIVLMQVRLIGAEEAFLAARLGAPYAEYRLRVPSVLASLRPRVPASGVRPRWGPALLGEINMWGVVAVYAMLGWRYNAGTLLQGAIVCFGLALVTRALFPRAAPAAV